MWRNAPPARGYRDPYTADMEAMAEAERMRDSARSLLVAAPELALTAGSEMGRMALAGTAALGSVPRSLLFGGDVLGNAAQTAREGFSGMTYQPRAPETAETVEAAGRLLSPLVGPVADFWGDRVVPATQEAFGTPAGSALSALAVAGMDVAGPGPKGSKGAATAGLPKALAKRLDGLDSGTRELVDLLTPEERDNLTWQQVDRIASATKEMPGVDELVEFAKLGWPKKGWYENATRSLLQVLPGNDARRFAMLTAALSPQTSVQSNLRNTMRVWRAWEKEGRPNDPDTISRLLAENVEGDKGEKSVLEAWRTNSLRVLSAAEDQMPEVRISGPKVSSFAENLLGKFSEVTNDTWMARILNTDQKAMSGSSSTKVPSDEFGQMLVKNGDYLAASLLSRKIAQELGVNPSEAQEVLWTAGKALWERRKNSPTTRIASMIDTPDARAAVAEQMKEVPDFSTLLREKGEFRDIATDLGWDVDSLPAHIDPGEAPPVRPRILQRYAREVLDPRFARERLPAIQRRWAAGVLPQMGGDLPGPGRAYEGPFAARRPEERWGFKVQPYSLAQSQSDILKSFDVATPRWFELPAGDPRAAQMFFDAIGEAKQKNPLGAAVTQKSVDDYIRSRLIMTEDAKSGFALADDDITSFFRDPDSKIRGAAQTAIPLGVQLGGSVLDNFDIAGGLPNIYSSTGGFQISGRNRWSDEFAPDDWDKVKMQAGNLGEPDVVAMHLDPMAEKFTRYPLQPEGRYRGTHKSRLVQLAETDARAKADGVDPYTAMIRLQKEKRDAAIQRAKQRGSRLVEEDDD
jgi:hypothetical protein